MGQVSSSRWECAESTRSCGVEEGGGSEAGGGDRGIDISILGVDQDLVIHMMTEAVSRITAWCCVCCRMWFLKRKYFGGKSFTSIYIRLDNLLNHLS